MSNNINQIGYKASYYDTYSDLNFKKKKVYINKTESINFNSIFLISIFLTFIYVISHYCLFNFNIPIISDIDKNDTSNSFNNNRNMCQIGLNYLINFEYFYLSLIFYIIILFITIYIAFKFKILHFIYYNYILYYINYFFTCYISYYKNYKNIINIFYKKKNKKT